MRILLINELYRAGGAEVQTLREIGVLREHGHKVFHITFDNNLPRGWNEDHFNFHQENCNWHIKKMKRYFIDRKLKKELCQIIESISPDLIHINNMTYKSVTVYSSIGKWKCIQTIRDFGAVCPRGLCVDLQYNACSGVKDKYCAGRCNSSGKIKHYLYLIMDQIYLNRVNKVRQTHIKNFISPSQYLTDICKNNHFDISCINNSFDFSAIDNFDKINIGDKKIYLVYGLVAKHKGIKLIVEAFELFSINRNVELRIIGKIDEPFKDEFMNLISKSKKIKYLGVMEYEEIIEYLKSIYAVIVPSLWLENYPNTALEGLAMKCLVLGANRGGIPELIDDERFTFDILKKEDIINRLIYSYTLSNEEYKNIVLNNYSRVILNNNLRTYYERIINKFEQIIEC